MVRIRWCRSHKHTLALGLCSKYCTFFCDRGWLHVHPPEVAASRLKRSARARWRRLITKLELVLHPNLGSPPISLAVIFCHRLTQGPFQAPLSFMRKAGLRVAILPPEVMPAGKHFFDHNYEKNYVQLYHEKTLIVHNNWLKGHDEKRSRFRRHHLWDVDETAFPVCEDPLMIEDALSDAKTTSAACSTFAVRCDMTALLLLSSCASLLASKFFFY